MAAAVVTMVMAAVVMAMVVMAMVVVMAVVVMAAAVVTMVMALLGDREGRGPGACDKAAARGCVRRHDGVAADAEVGRQMEDGAAAVQSAGLREGPTDKVERDAAGGLLVAGRAHGHMSGIAVAPLGDTLDADARASEHRRRIGTTLMAEGGVRAHGEVLVDQRRPRCRCKAEAGQEESCGDGEDSLLHGFP